MSLATLARAVGGKHGLIEMARLSKHRRLVQIIALWDGMGKNACAHTRIEDLLEEVGISPAEFFGECVKAAYQSHLDVSALVLACSQPRLTRRLVALAMRPSGAKQMEMALKAAGRFPMPSGHVLPLMRVAAVAKPIPEPPSVQGLPSAEEDAILDAECQRVAEK